MARGGINHLDLTVSDPRRSAAFYDRILGYMGYKRSRSDDGSGGADWFAPKTSATPMSIGIYPAKPESKDRQHDRYAPGLHHVAFHADSRADVDRFHQLLLEIGAKILDPPAEYPQYGDPYYAVFFSDPDGLKLEFVYWPQPK
jgi:glyoxylase I family protein